MGRMKCPAWHNALWPSGMMKPKVLKTGITRGRVRSSVWISAPHLLPRNCSDHPSTGAVFPTLAPSRSMHRDAHHTRDSKASALVHPRTTTCPPPHPPPLSTPHVRPSSSPPRWLGMRAGPRRSASRMHGSHRGSFGSTAVTPGRPGPRRPDAPRRGRAGTRSP